MTDVRTADNFRGLAPIEATAGGGGGDEGWQLITTSEASSSSSLDFTGFDPSLFGAYQFILEGIVAQTSTADLLIRFSSDGGSTYSTASYHGGYSTIGHNNVAADVGAANQSGIILAPSVGNTASNQFYGGDALITSAGTTKWTSITHHGMFTSSANVHTNIQGGLKHGIAQDTDAAQVIFSTGNIVSGKVHFIGQVL